MQNLFREDEVFVRLVRRCHPGTQTFIEKDVPGVEGLEFGIFCSADLLRHEVVGAQVEGEEAVEQRALPRGRTSSGKTKFSCGWSAGAIQARRPSFRRMFLV